MWSAEQNINQAGKEVFHKIPAFPVMSLTKILETFIRSFPSSFNRKYVHMVTWTVTLIRAAMLLVPFPAVQTKTMVTGSI